MKRQVCCAERLVNHKSRLFEILQLKPGPPAGSQGSQRLLDGDSHVLTQDLGRHKCPR